MIGSQEEAEDGESRKPTGEWVSFRSSTSHEPEPPLTVEQIVDQSITDLPGGQETDLMRSRLCVYVDMLLETNTRINLVSRRGTTHHVARFVRESLFLARFLRIDMARFPTTPRLLDLGSGGGFPGIVLKIALPEVEVQLVEGTRKKAKFLAEASTRLDLPGMSVLWGRSEQIAALESGSGSRRFEWVTGKALGTIVESSRLATPFLAPGGVHWTFKGAACEAELAQASGYFRQAGLAPFVVEPIPGAVESYVVGIQRRSRG